LLELDIPLIEDCAQAVGAEYNQGAVGSFGIAAIYSFYATKVITTGEGGMVVSDSSDITDRIRNLKSYDQKEEYKIRFNYKMTDIQAALGLSQLDRLDTIIRRRRTIADQYTRSFKDIAVTLPPDDPGHIFFRYVLGLDKNCSPWIQHLADKGVGGDRPVYLPLHRQLNREDCPVSDLAWNNSLSIPIYPSLTDDEVTRIIDAVVITASQMK